MQLHSTGNSAVASEITMRMDRLGRGVRLSWPVPPYPGLINAQTRSASWYPRRFNYIWAKYDDVVVCVYDSSRFDADLLVQILRTHPFSIVGGILRENPFYVPPDRLLRELLEV